ncbi:hypothetical protein VTO42DRAFT_2753 [Malbranchea cinnamomea]
MVETSEATIPSIPINSYQTALCIFPPSDREEEINRLRSLYDKAYTRWPPHMNIVYPFVPVDRLSEAIERICTELAKIRWKGGDDAKLELCLNTAGYFPSRHKNTVYISPRDYTSHVCENAIERADWETGSGYPDLHWLREVLMKALGHPSKIGSFNPHLTLATITPQNTELLDALLSKARLLLPLHWDVRELHIMTRLPSGKLVMHKTLKLTGEKTTI